MASKEEFLRKSPDHRRIIMFNGPPQSGKSFGAHCVRMFILRNAAWMQPRLLDMAEPLKKAAHALYCAFHSWDYYDSKDGEAAKGLASGDFLGLSPREAYIEMFLDLERRHGSEVLGFLMKKRMLREAGTVAFILHNMGRLADMVPLVDFAGQRGILLIEVHTQDRTFEGDIRGYIGNEAKEQWPHINVVKLPNVIGTQADKDLYRILCEGTAKKFLKIEEKDG